MSADFTICCDGALVKYLRQSKSIFGQTRTPDVVIGDMDTLSASMQKKYSDIIIKEDEQEHNDQTKAVRWAVRLDHTIGNASLLMEYTRMFDLDSKDIAIDMVTDEGTAFAVNDTTEFDCGVGRRISIFSPDNTLQIRSRGLEYPTDEVVFDNWWKATLNKAVDDTVKLEFSHPSMALIILD